MKLSGWCSGPIGCYSKADHQTCQDRITRGLLMGYCECDQYGPHDPKEESAD